MTISSSVVNKEVSERTDELNITSLVCGCDDFQMHKLCGHVTSIIKNNEDAPLGPGLVRVPMWLVPEFQPVVVITFIPDQPLLKVGLLIEQTGTDGMVGREQGAAEFLGFITHTQGRKYLRVMIDEWFTETDAANAKITCSSPHHTNFINPNKKLRPGMTTRRHLRDVYFAYTTGWCHSCHQANGIPDV